MKFLVLCLTTFALSSSQAFAWGERGHHTICEIAAREVQNPVLNAFLMTRLEIMGHICNIPDIYWQDLGPSTRPGYAAHFMNPENIGLTVATAPTNISDYYAHDTRPEDNTGEKKNERAGSLWWRAQQFYDLAVQEGQGALHVPFPSGRDQQQSKELEYNRAVLGFMTDLGLMGHFVGDASMPFHTTADYDGQNENHGGIHAFYEGSCVSWFDFALPYQVEQATLALLQNSAQLPATDIALEGTREVALLSANEKQAVLDADRLVPQSASRKPGGRGGSHPAVRLALPQACPAFRPLIVSELARSAATLARLWDQAYIDAGSPDLSKYRSYNYPLTPDFVYPEYLRSL